LATHVDGFIGYLTTEHQLDVTYISGGKKTMKHKHNLWNEIVMTYFKILVIHFWRMDEKPWRTCGYVVMHSRLNLGIILNISVVALLLYQFIILHIEH